MIEARVTLTQPNGTGRQFIGHTGGGHHFLMDDKDGLTGPKPIELVAAGLAGCTAMDVITILRKKRKTVTGYEVFVEAEQSPQPPAVFTSVRIRHVVTGADVDEKSVAEAIRLSEEKYCAVGNMLNKTAVFHTTFEIVTADAAAAAAAH